MMVEEYSSLSRLRLNLSIVNYLTVLNKPKLGAGIKCRT